MAQGLLPNQPVHLTEGGIWAASYYGCQPIYLAKRPWYELLSDAEDFLAELAVIYIPSPLQVVADLPSLVDLGGQVTDDECLWWEDEDDIPRHLVGIHDWDDGIPIEDLVLPGYSANLAIEATQTAACLLPIPPEHLRILR